MGTWENFGAGGVWAVLWVSDCTIAVGCGVWGGGCKVELERGGYKSLAEGGSVGVGLGWLSPASSS